MFLKLNASNRPNNQNIAQIKTFQTLVNADNSVLKIIRNFMGT